MPAGKGSLVACKKNALFFIPIPNEIKNNLQNKKSSIFSTSDHGMKLSIP